MAEVAANTGKIWLGSNSRKYPTLQIPIALAKKHEMDRPCSIIFISTHKGILIKKIEDLEFD